MDLEFPTTAAALGQWFGASIIGDPSASVRELSPLENAKEGSLSFCANRKFSDVLAKLKGAVLFASQDVVQPELPVTYLIVGNPRAAFAEVARKCSDPTLSLSGISERAVIDPTAKLGSGVAVGPFAVIEAGAEVGEGSIVGAFSYIGHQVKIGRSCSIYSRVTLLDRIFLGDYVKIFPGSVIGGDGFGMVQQEGSYAEIPQLGTVRIESHVRIGANCTIDRATFGETLIGEGSKLDDQVHVGHNCSVGKNCVLCAQVGLAGSVVLEDNVVLGGQVGIGDHLRVGKGARMGGQSGAIRDVEGGKDYFLTPCFPMAHSMRIISSLEDLPSLAKRLKRLESRLETSLKNEK